MKEITAIPHQKGNESANEGDFLVALHLTGVEGLVCVHAHWMKVLLTVDPEQVKCLLTPPVQYTLEFLKTKEKEKKLLLLDLK